VLTPTLTITHDTDTLCPPSNTTDNILIRGDNLRVLKELLPKYEGKVKCVYIDPPYNTGNTFFIVATTNQRQWRTPNQHK